MLMKRKRGETYFFQSKGEDGTVLRENPPLSLKDLRRMRDSGDLLTTRELSDYMGWSVRYVYMCMQENEGIDYLRVGKNYFFSKKKIRKWLKKRE